MDIELSNVLIKYCKGMQKTLADWESENSEINKENSPYYHHQALGIGEFIAYVAQDVDNKQLHIAGEELQGIAEKLIQKEGDFWDNYDPFRPDEAEEYIRWQMEKKAERQMEREILASRQTTAEKEQALVDLSHRHMAKDAERYEKEQRARKNKSANK